MLTVLTGLLAPAAPGALGVRRGACGAWPVVQRITGGARVVRAGRSVPRPHWLERGDRIVTRRHGRVRLSSPAGRLRVGASTLILLECRAAPGRRHALAPRLVRGRLALASRRRGADVASSEARVRVAPHARVRITRAALARRTRVEAGRGSVRLAPAARRRPTLLVRGGQVGLADVRGLSLDIYPFALSPADRAAATRDALPAFWADGAGCSVGCRPGGARAGWPLRPFHRQHALRAGLNELRPANLHVGIDIQARDGAPVYAVQPGRVHVLAASGIDERVQVGALIYWHIDRRVGEGRVVRPFRTVLGTVKPAFGHLHLSEVDASGRYLNPLRPGGRVLAPWRDAERPVLGAPRVLADGRAYVAAFDPQSFVTRTTYSTPVIAPAALAWRLFDHAGRRVGRLHFALRGSQHLSDGLRGRVFAPGASSAGFTCFAVRRLCRPSWRYVLAGGLAPRIPADALDRGRGLRLAVYAWDWAGNVTAREAPVAVARRGRAGSAWRHAGAPAWELE